MYDGARLFTSILCFVIQVGVNFYQISVLFLSTEHVWPVTVEAIDGKNVIVPPGSYRLCLTATNLTLIPLWSSTQSEIVLPVSN